MIEKLFDKDKHEIGKLELIENEQGKTYMLTINGKYRHYFVSAIPEWIKQGICGFTTMQREGEYPKLEQDEDKKREEVLQANAEAIHSNVAMFGELLKGTMLEGKDIGQGILDQLGMEAITTEDGCSDLARKHRNVWTDLYNLEGKYLGQMEEGTDGFLQVFINSETLNVFFKCWHYPNAEDFEGQCIKNQIAISDIFPEFEKGEELRPK